MAETQPKISLIWFKIPIGFLLQAYTRVSALSICTVSCCCLIHPLLQQGLQLTPALESQLQSLRAADGHLAEHLSKENTQGEPILAWVY